MKMTLDLPDSLVSEAMQLTHAQTQTQAVIFALQELLKKNTADGLKAYKGELGSVPESDVLQRDGVAIYHDLDSVFGTWTEQEFQLVQGRVEQESQVDPELWA